MTIDLARRIRRPEEDDDLLKKLTDSCFSTMADALVFAASLAFFKSCPRRSFVKTAEPIPASVFINAQYDDFINMLAAELTKDYQILLPERMDERILVFEELAAAGLAFIRDALQRDSRRPAEDVLRDLALTGYRADTGQADPNFARLLSELGE